MKVQRIASRVGAFRCNFAPSKMEFVMNKFLSRSLVVAGVMGAASAANAAIDVTAVVTEIGLAAAPIGLIGSAVLLIVVAIMAFKWVRRAF